MSRRHTSTLPATVRRAFGACLSVMLAIGVLLPVAAVAQNDGTISARQIQQEWQLLTQRDERGEPEDVPPGVGAIMQLRSGAAFGEGACSSYDSTYSQRANTLDVFIESNEVVWRECDATSRAFDEQFYRNLRAIDSIETADDVLKVNDEIGEPLMVFTRAVIPPDPTASRWSLARISDADGAVQPVIDGLDSWMEFLVGGSVVGNTGCGSFLGKYASNEGRIDITDVHYRLRCPTDGARSQAERMLTTLGDITDFQVRPAGLALEDENGIIRLALAPELDVGSRIWTPTVIYDASGGQQYGSGPELTTSAVAFIGPEYQGRSICRPFSGEALRSGLAIYIEERATTFYEKPKACQRKSRGIQLGDVEAALITALEDAASYSLRGDELTLTDVEGVDRAVFEPQPPLTGTTWEVYRMNNGKKLAAPKSDEPITATFTELGAATRGLVYGKTGVRNEADENEYFADYDSPTATRIDISGLVPDGKGCSRKLRKTPACKSEKRFINLLNRADGYVVRPGEVWLFRGRKTIISLRPLQLNDLDA